MDTYMLQDANDSRALLSAVQRADEPVSVYDGEDECMIAMRPAVFERILFDSDILNCESRDLMHI